MCSNIFSEEDTWISSIKDPLCENREHLVMKLCNSCIQSGSDYLMSRILCELSFSDFPELVTPICGFLRRVPLNVKNISRIRRLFTHWAMNLPDSRNIIKDTAADLSQKYPDFQGETLWT